jgi:bacterial/archaeal transporter family-2 protein
LPFRQPLTRLLGKAIKLPSFAALIPFLLGIIPLFVYYLIESRGFRQGSSSGLKWWYFLGGIMSALYVFTITWTVPKLGATIVLSATIVGQVSLGLLVDHYGWLEQKIPVSLWRMLGTGMVILGAVFLDI